jgi:MFS family permease
MRASKWSGIGFLIVGGVAVAGTIIGQLGATSAVTYASTGSGGIETGVFLGLLILFSGITSARVHRITARWGRIKVFTIAQFGVVASWASVGIVESFTDASIVVLWLAAPIFGLFTGITAVLTPFIARSYLYQSNITDAVARRGAVAGVAAMLGASLGGFLIHETDPGVGIFANAVLTIPLAIFLIVRQPCAADEVTKSSVRSARVLLVALWSDPRLRQLALLTALWNILIVPLFNMVVPILNDLKHSPLPSGAGLMIAGIAAGRMFVPVFIKRLLRSNSDFRGAIWATILGSGLALIFAISTVLPVSGFDLMIWTLIGFVLGASRFTARSLLTGAGAKSDPEGDEISGVAALALVITLTLPVGILIWGFAIEFLSAPVTVAAAALGMMMVSVRLARHSSANADSLPGASTPPKPDSPAR